MSYAESLSSLLREVGQRDEGTLAAAGSTQAKAVRTEVQTAAEFPAGKRPLMKDAVTQAMALTGVYVNAAKTKFEKG